MRARRARPGARRSISSSGISAKPACIAAVALALAGAGCGDDDEGGDRAATDTAARTDTAPQRTETERGSETDGGTDTERGAEPAPTTEEPPSSPEDQPGGAGDEEPARSLAQFTGRGGRISPAVVRVPPFIAIRVELRSADGRAYALRFGERTIQAGGSLASSSTTLDGLRPGRAYRGRQVDGGSGTVRVEASAEPGP